MLIEAILFISPYGDLLLATGAVYLIVSLAFYHAKYKRNEFELNQYYRILFNMFIAALIFFSGPTLLLLADMKKIEFPVHILAICAILPSIILVLFAVANLLLIKKMKAKGMRSWFLND
jgi:hypothetical protein